MGLHASTTIGNYLVPRLLASFQHECPGGLVEARIGNRFIAHCRALQPDWPAGAQRI